MKTEFQINSEEFKGPFNLYMTIMSGQTSQPAWKEKGGYFQELILVNKEPCLIKIKQKEQDHAGSLNVIAESPVNIQIDDVKKKIMDIFDLNNDLNNLYHFLEDEHHLRPTIDFCRGLRLFKAQDPFECIVSSISSANCSIVRWNRSIRHIKEKWGNRIKFSSGCFYTFPSPNILSQVPEHNLEEMQRNEDYLGDDFHFINNLKACGVGYRAKYIIKAADMVNSEIKLSKLARMNYNKAFDTIIEIPGVGPKVADCILFYGFGMGRAFPVDVWIKRIIEHLYFPEKELKPQEVRLFGMKNFRDFAGYVQLYLFHYARKSGLLETIKK